MSSELMWVFGVVLLVGSLAMLWNIRMSTHAHTVAGGDSADAEQDHGEHDLPLGRYRAMPRLTPTTPASSATPATEAVGVHTAPIENQAPQKTQAVLEATLPDHEDVELHLTLAGQLQIVGDYEGAAEYASMVVDDQRASIRQRDRAQALLRRDSVA